jgi:hypothetical protein
MSDTPEDASCPTFPASMSAVGRRQQIATLRERQKHLIRDLASRDRPRTPEDHAAGLAIARELESIQTEIDQLEGGQ